ncbi:MAG TPA: acylphosphatase [Turneriella sp.]|nr:acylphosphatase [Turneriella sp.]
MKKGENLHRRYCISGKVQGVGFRQFTQQTAQKLNIAGWVRNLPDGRVETEAEGDAVQLEAFEKALREGPPLGRVDGVGVNESTVKGNLPTPFEVRR